MTDDFASHLSLEHRATRVFEDPMGLRHVRRMPHAARATGRSRRSNMAFHSPFSGGNAPPSGLSAMPPTARDSMDPIAGTNLKFVA